MAYFVDRYKSMLVDHDFDDTSCKQVGVTSTQQTLDLNKGWDQNNDIDFWNRPHNYTNRINGSNTEGYKGVCNSLLMDNCNRSNIYKVGICNLNLENNDNMYLNVYNKGLGKKSLYKNIN